MPPRGDGVYLHKQQLTELVQSIVKAVTEQSTAEQKKVTDKIEVLSGQVVALRAQLACLAEKTKAADGAADAGVDKRRSAQWDLFTSEAFRVELPLTLDMVRTTISAGGMVLHAYGAKVALRKQAAGLGMPDTLGWALVVFKFAHTNHKGAPAPPLPFVHMPCD